MDNRTIKEFFNQCMLFKSKEKINIILGVATWFCTISIFLVLILLAYLINLINN
jgi:hypothetical protein